MYELLVVGGGPAGLSAALNARRRDKGVLLATKETISSKLRPAGRIENYPGLPGVSGPELAERFREHAAAVGVEIRQEEILSIQPGESGFFVIGKNEGYEAAAVILATGAPQKASIPGEARLAGRGVSYCATCDGMFFRDKDVMVISQLPAGEEEAAFLAGICRKVYYLPEYKGEYRLPPGVELVSGKVLRLEGDEQLERVVTSESEYRVAGVFLERAGLPPEQLCPGLAMADDAIQVDRRMATNIPG
ncbi:MAG: NAD(P)/FAD-dependent oxidoreductase, partial [Clostridia bacterium]|nr:NAD(P)/FAD-dependent oxidoreductase [Clostridia bacterium]